MKSSDVAQDGFTILSDEGQMIGNATVSDRKRVTVNDVQTFGDAYQQDVVDRMQAFAETEARRLGLLDE